MITARGLETDTAGLWSRLPWFVGYGVATFFAFPQLVPGRSDPIDLGPVSAPLAVCCLLMAVRELAPKQALLQAFVASMVAHWVFFYWFYVVTVTYGHAPVALGVLAPLFPSLDVSIFTAAFAFGSRALSPAGRVGPWLAALLWTVADYARAHAFGGFTWAMLGYAELQNSALLGWVSITGVYGLSFFVALTGAALAAWLCDGTRKPPRATTLALSAVVIAHVAGVLLSQSATARNEVEGEGVSTIRVAALQGNIDQNEKWSAERVGNNLGVYIQLSRQAIAAGASVIVWPESAVPSFLEHDPTVREPIAWLARESGATFVLGATGATLDATGENLAEVFDSAFVMAPSGVVTDRYDKTHLVPFGEYVPFRKTLGAWFEAIARGMASLDVTAGDRVRSLLLASESDGAEYRIGVPICYELLFPHLVRRFAADGAQVLLAITNDAWYGRTGAPHQFLAMTAMRAAENSLWTVRAANSGVSAIINSQGRIVSHTEIYERDLVVGDIPLSQARAGGTFYTRYGDVFAWLCCVALLGHVVRLRLQSVPGTSETQLED